MIASSHKDGVRKVKLKLNCMHQSKIMSCLVCVRGIDLIIWFSD